MFALFLVAMIGMFGQATDVGNAMSQRRAEAGVIEDELADTDGMQRCL